MSWQVLYLLLAPLLCVLCYCRCCQQRTVSLLTLLPQRLETEAVGPPTLQVQPAIPNYPALAEPLEREPKGAGQPGRTGGGFGYFVHYYTLLLLLRLLHFTTTTMLIKYIGNMLSSTAL